jgi:GntR family transcriptional regulator
MSRPKDYERIVRSITEKIYSGILEPGQRLPTYRQLAQEYQVSVTTLQTALRLLRALGLVEGQQGKGVWVADPLPPRRA